jgi:hypothetical protein
MQSNLLLSKLHRKDQQQLLAACEKVHLCIGDTLCEPQSPIRNIYFPLNCSISQLQPISPRQTLELALISNEGMLDVSLVLGVRSSTLLSRVQSSGAALRISASAFDRKLEQVPKLRRLLNRYIYVLQAQLALTATCNRLHSLDLRLARWLLMTHDCAGLSNFHLTHKLLGQMLGVRREGITKAAGILQKRGLLSYTRGEIKILRRTALERASCSCYQVSKDVYERVLG